MRRVVHLGPINSAGGMASVMKNMVNNPPDGWFASSISTHGNSSISKLSSWVSSKREFHSRVRKGDIDLAHIHVTHSVSWWRKLGIMKICDKFNVPSVIHIHSGKFRTFCSGFAGISVKNNLSKPNRGVIVLEDRWIDMLEKWLPENTSVIRNFSPHESKRIKKLDPSAINLLMLSRDSPVKQHNFAFRIIQAINDIGGRVNLDIAGGTKNGVRKFGESNVKWHGWVSEREKLDLIKNADFLLSPSIYEGSSMSVIESMSSDLLCVVSPASAETIGLKNLVVEDFNPELWAQKIKNLSESKNYQRMLDEVRISSKRFDMEKNKNLLGSLYSNLVSN